MHNKIEQSNNYKHDLLMMLAAPVLMSWYYYGERALKLLVLSVALSLVLSFAGDVLLKRKTVFLSASAAATGIMIALMLPASASYSLLTATILFAFIVCRLPFGNGDKTPFVPAAAAIAFATVCREVSVFTYPSLSYPVTEMSDPAFVSGGSLASSLVSGNSIYPSITSVIEVLIGDYPGPMGATCTLALLAVGVFMLIRHGTKFLIFAGYILSAGVFAALFPRILTGSISSVVMELCAGMLIFGGLFLMTEPYCSPDTPLAAFLYGIAGGILVMLFRKFGIFEDSTCFAVLIMNALSPLFSKIVLKKRVSNEKEAVLIEG